MVLQILSWLAVGVLSVSYWFQIWKIHVHKEVRDLSMTFYVLMGLGFGTLAIAAYEEHSTLFLVKQILTTIPVVIIIIQILYHRNDTWHDDELSKCKDCSGEIEKHWKFCAYCGEKGPNKTEKS